MNAIERLSTLIVVCGLSLPLAAQQADMSDVEIKVVPVTTGVYMLQGAGGNIGVSVGADATFIIDDQFAPLTAKIVAAVAGVSKRPIDFVLNTHWHFDHIGGNENLGKAGALIFAHDNVRVRMLTTAAWRGQSRDASPPAALPVVTFGDDLTLHINGQTIRGVHGAPAHTDGDTIVHFKEANVIHTGDLMMPDRYPFIDQESGGNYDGFIANAKTMLALADDQTKIIPGHGELSTKADLQRYHDTLSTIRGRVAALVAQGKSKPDVIAAKPTADLDDEWGSGFVKADALVGAAYDAVTSSR